MLDGVTFLHKRALTRGRPRKYQDNIGIMEKKIETTLTVLYRVEGLGLGLNWDNGKENGNYYVIVGYVLGLYWDSELCLVILLTGTVARKGNPFPLMLKPPLVLNSTFTGLRIQKTTFQRGRLLLKGATL